MQVSTKVLEKYLDHRNTLESALTLIARKIGLDHIGFDSKMENCGLVIAGGPSWNKFWNPVANTEQAMELALKLNMSLVMDNQVISVRVDGKKYWMDVIIEKRPAIEVLRLAIVECAYTSFSWQPELPGAVDFQSSIQ